MLGTADAAVIITAILALLVWSLKGHLIRAWFKHGKTEGALEFVDQMKLQSGRVPDTLPAAAESVFSIEELRTSLEAIPGVSAGNLLESLLHSKDTYLAFAYNFMRNTGVVTRRQLTELASSVEIRAALARIYVDVLKRPEAKPLDAIAVATWGSYLYLYGVNERTLRAVREAVKQFPEYVKVSRILPPTRKQ
jgi:pentatricopeptide repeat protein